MKYVPGQDIACKKCGVVNDYRSVFVKGNLSHQTWCCSCDAFIDNLSYWTELELVYPEIKKVLFTKTDKVIDEKKLIARYPQIHPFALVNRIKNDYPEFIFT